MIDNLHYTIQSINSASAGNLFALTRKDSTMSQLYFSQDTGKHWEQQYQFNTAMYHIYQTNDSLLWACGKSASIYCSTDNGKSWQKKLNNDDGWLAAQNPTFRKMIMKPNHYGIIVGGSFYKNGFICFSPSGNGGDWIFYTLPNELHDIYPLNDTSILIVGYGTAIIFNTHAKNFTQTTFKGDNLTAVSTASPILACGYETGIYQYIPENQLWKRIYKNRVGQHWQVIDNQLVAGNSGLLFNTQTLTPIQTSVNNNFTASLQISDSLYILGDNTGKIYFYHSE